MIPEGRLAQTQSCAEGDSLLIADGTSAVDVYVEAAVQPGQAGAACGLNYGAGVLAREDGLTAHACMLFVDEDTGEATLRLIRVALEMGDWETVSNYVLQSATAEVPDPGRRDDDPPGPGSDRHRRARHGNDPPGPLRDLAAHGSRR